MSDPKWLSLARAELGTKEVAGQRHNPKVVEWFADSGNAWIKDDETAWCAAFANAMLVAAGEKGTGAVAARSFLKWGKKLTKPVPGCIVVFKRGNSSWQGHVAFFLRDLGDRIEVLGGNQSNSVSIARYKKADLLGYRWPDTVRGSSVIKGSGIAAAGGAGLTADSATELAYQFQEADGHISAGSIFGLVVGAIIVGGALWALYARWNAGGRPVPDWFPIWLKAKLA